MVRKELIHNFTIKLAAPVKVIKKSNVNSRASRKCFAIVIEEDGTLKAKVSTSPVKVNDEKVNKEFLLLPLTDDSLNLKGKRYAFLLNKDRYNHYVCVIRDTFKSLFAFGTLNMYRALRPGLLISGHIVRNNGKMYFDYEQLIAFSENSVHINEVRIDEDRPLFD